MITDNKLATRLPQASVVPVKQVDFVGYVLRIDLLIQEYLKNPETTLDTILVIW